MKKYEMPEIELKLFAVEDIIATSDDVVLCPDDVCIDDNGLGWN